MWNKNNNRKCKKDKEELESNDESTETKVLKID